MKRLGYIIIAFALFMSSSYAQDITKLTVPSSPAFSILGFEPTAVMRPTNARSLSSDFLNSFDKEGKLLMNLGMEVTPYWLKSHPDLLRKNYLNPDLGHTILQSLSLSAATVKDSISGNDKMGVGFRFKLYNGAPLNEELNKASSEVQTKTLVISIINGFKNIVSTGVLNTREDVTNAIENALKRKSLDPKLIAEVRKDAENLGSNYTDDPESIALFLNALINSREQSYHDLAKKISDLLYQRKGLIVEVAGASGFNASNNNRLEKIGIWGNISYAVSPDDFFTLTSRYMFRNMDTAYTNIDIGLGFLKKASDYNVSIEAMMRHQSAEIPTLNINNQSITQIEKDFTWRLAVQGSFKISEVINLNLSLGKDFDSPFVKKSGFFSILGLNYSLFSKEVPHLK